MRPYELAYSSTAGTTTVGSAAGIVARQPGVQGGFLLVALGQPLLESGLGAPRRPTVVLRAPDVALVARYAVMAGVRLHYRNV